MAKMGRPRKYSMEFIEKTADAMVEFFLNNEDEYFITAFCVEIGTYKQKMSEWANENEHFSEQLKIAKGICETRLAKLAIEGRTPAGAIFALKCQHDWKDVIHTENKTEITAEGGLAAMIAAQGEKHDTE